MKRTAYYNGIIYTADDKAPRAEAFVTENGRFVFVGKTDDLPPCHLKVDLEGKCVIPGLVDSHCHMLAGVVQSVTSMLFVDESTTPEMLGKVLSDMVEETEEEDDGDKVIAAMGIDLTIGDFSADNIDCRIKDRPVIIFSNDGHGLLLNSLAMQKLGIDKDTPDPGDESFYARDEEGNPTGLVIEIPAMRPCKAILPKATVEEYKNILPGIAANYASLGYTTVFDAMSTYDRDKDVITALNLLDKGGKLELRVSTSFGYNGEEFMKAQDVVSLMKKNRDRFSFHNVICNTLKMIADGTVEERTALLYEPYCDDGESFGSEALTPEDMKKAASLAAKEGFDIHIHAIGDKAVGRAIDVLSGLGKIKGTKTIAHNQVYTEGDLERMIKAGDIVFQTTPHWMTADDHTRNCLGQERFKKQFPVGTMQRAGVTVSFGSDSCLEPDTASAFRGMYFACTRGDEKVHGEESLPPESEKITPIESLYAYTINGAKQLGLEAETGSIKVGKSADYVIIDRDIGACSPEEIKDISVLQTFFRGSKTYDHEDD